MTFPMMNCIQNQFQLQFGPKLILFFFEFLDQKNIEIGALIAKI